MHLPRSEAGTGPVMNAGERNMRPPPRSCMARITMNLQKLDEQGGADSGEGEQGGWQSKTGCAGRARRRTFHGSGRERKEAIATGRTLGSFPAEAQLLLPLFSKNCSCTRRDVPAVIRSHSAGPKVEWLSLRLAESSEQRRRPDGPAAGLIQYCEPKIWQQKR